jgi:hypothetical protein
MLHLFLTSTGDTAGSSASPSSRLEHQNGKLFVVTKQQYDCALEVAEIYSTTAGYRTPINQNVQFIQPESHYLKVCSRAKVQ